TLFEQVEIAYDAVSRVQTLSYELGRQKNSSFHVAVSPSIGHSIVPKCINHLRSEYEEVRLRYSALNADRLIRAVADGKADLGVLFTQTAHPLITSHVIGTVPVVCLMPRDHP